MMNLTSAWDVTTGDPGVVVAVVDSGIRYDHADLAPNLLPGIDVIEDPVVSGDGDGRDSDATDPDPIGEGSHGTHVAGTIAAVGDNGFGISGVTWNCKVLPIRALGPDDSSNFDLEFAYANIAARVTGTTPAPGQPAVVNLSLGAYAPTTSEQNAVAAMQAKDILVVAAAGNDGQHRLTAFPASYPGVLSVAAVTRSGQLAAYSNYGPRIDVTAPGGRGAYPDGIYSTNYVGPNGAVNDFDYKQGTSMACPHVAGLAALLRSANPALSARRIGEIIKGTAAGHRSDEPEMSMAMGYGLVDAWKAVLVAIDDPYGPAPAARVKHPLVYIDAGEHEWETEIVNAGRGTVTLNPTPTSTAAWAVAELDGTSTPAKLTIRVDRAGLRPGWHEATITVGTDHGTASVDVVAEVVETSADLGRITVLAITKSTGAVIATTSTSAATGFKFTLSGLPTGDYRLVAGTDRQVAGRLGDEGEYYGEPQSAGRGAAVIPVVAPTNSGPITIPVARLASAISGPRGTIQAASVLPGGTSNVGAHKLMKQLAAIRERLRAGGD